jgi:hypothetical protein
VLLRTVAPVLALLSLTASAGFAATPDQPLERDAGQVASPAFYTIGGGEVKVRFNTSFLEPLGIQVAMPQPPASARARDVGFSVFRTSPADGLHFSASKGSLEGFTGGLLRVEGGFGVQLPDGESISYDGFHLRANRANPLRFDLVGSDGQSWFYVNHLMFELVDDGARFDMRAADLRMAPALASRIGMAELADAYVGGLHMTLDVLTRGAGGMGEIAMGGPDFHGDPFPGGGIYEADVLMQNYDFQVMRCRRTGGGACDGAGPDDGEVVFAPNSTLRNTNNPNTAHIPWYEKFTGGSNPYGYPYPNADQHPYLIWNLYRVIDGQLEQVGESGVKHAWLTTNGGCSAPFGSHILSPNCSDTYGTGNNDAPDDLGPRTEIIPHLGYFGRCGSIFDTNCDGSSNGVGSDQYRARMVVRESQLANPDAQYYSDSWYVVQDDINIYNTMMHRTIAPAPGGGGWVTGTQGPTVVGPVLNAWVSPTTSPMRNVEIDTDEGHTRIAVKVKTLASCPGTLSGTCYRYDYAVHNFDFARAVYGAPPNDQPPNLRIVSNRGFSQFTVPIPTTGAALESNHFADVDIDAGNNWTATIGADAVTWVAPAGNELNWGTLYRFSLVTNTAPSDSNLGNVVLDVADAGTPSILQTTMMVPRAGVPGSHVVTATAGSGGTILPPSQVVANGGTATFTVTAQSGFTVGSVTGTTCTPINTGGATWTAANITAACAVTASFTANNHTVTATAGSGGTITPPSQSVVHGGTANFTVTAQTGFSVAGVTGNTCTPANNGNGTWSAPNITSACAVTATFAANTYTVTATAGTGGGITPPSQSVAHGGAANFTVTTQTGYAVANVTGTTCTPVNIGGNSWRASSITSACAVTATFTPNSYAVTATAGAGGAITPPSQSVAHGGTATFTLTPQVGYRVESVTGTTCTPFVSFDNTWIAPNITSACAVSAAFVAIEYTVTATAGEGGSISPPSQTVAAGGDATFTVTAQPEHEVVSVVGDTCTPVDNGDGTWTASGIDSDCAVTAVFVEHIFYDGFEGPTTR